MQTHEPTPIPPPETADVAGVGSTSAAPGSTGPARVRSRAAQIWALTAGVVAALGSWLLIEASYDRFKPTATPTRFMASTFMVVAANERASAGLRNAYLAFGLMGAAVGLIMGLAGGLARKRPWAAATAALLGLAVGAAAGAGTARAALPVASLVHDQDPGNMSAEMFSSLLAHGAPWGAVGAAGGLAFGIGLGDRRRAVRTFLGGMLGGVAGAILYGFLGALALPEVKILNPIATTRGVRLLAQVLAVIPAAAGVAALLAEPKPAPPARRAA